MSLENQLALSSSNPSPYPLSETETGFAFTTERGVVYHVDFTSDSDYLPDTPFADSVYSFSILPVAGSGSFDRKDPRSEPTIIQALHVFFASVSTAVLLYVCSTENDQERVRAVCLDNGSPAIKKALTSSISITLANVYICRLSFGEISRRVGASS